MRMIPSVKTKDFNKMGFALALILVGAIGRVLLSNYANFETVLVVSLVAGTLLGKIYVLIVPIVTMAISDAAIYLLGLGLGFGIGALIGITVFTWTGFLFVSFMGTRLKGKVICVTKSIALVTGVGIVATLIYDVWTTIGFWYFLYPHTLGGLSWAFGQLTPFAIYHLMSSLIFIPLIGTIFIYVHEHGIPSLHISPIAKKSDDDQEAREVCLA